MVQFSGEGRAEQFKGDVVEEAAHQEQELVVYADLMLGADC